MKENKNNRFVYEGVSFTFPDEMYMDTGFDIREGGMVFATVNNDYYMIFTFVQCNDIAEKILEICLREEGITPLDGINSFEMNGLTGCRTLYKTNNREYFDMQFNPAEGHDLGCSVVIFTNQKTSISETLNNENIKTFLNSISAE